MKVILLAWRRASIALGRSVLYVWRLAGIAFLVPAPFLVRLAAVTPVTTTDGSHSLDFRRQALLNRLHGCSPCIGVTWEHSRKAPVTKGLRTRVPVKKDQKNIILRVTLYGLSLIAHRQLLGLCSVYKIASGAFDIAFLGRRTLSWSCADSAFS